MTQPDVPAGWPTVEGFGRCGVKAITKPAAVEPSRSSGVFGPGKKCRAPLSALQEKAFYSVALRSEPPSRRLPMSGRRFATVPRRPQTSCA